MLAQVFPRKLAVVGNGSTAVEPPWSRKAIPLALQLNGVDTSEEGAQRFHELKVGALRVDVKALHWANLMHEL